MSKQKYLLKVNKFKKIIQKINLSIRKNRSYSFYDIIKFITNFFSIYIPALLFICVPFFLEYNIANISTWGWITIFTAPLFITILAYIRENFVTSKKEKNIKRDKVIFSCIASAIKLMSHQDFNMPDNKKEFIQNMLNYLQRVVNAILFDENIPVGTICANLMIYYDNPSRLVLEYIGIYTEGHGEEKFKLEVDYTNPLIGAPAAFVNEKTVYISDTGSEKYSIYFKEEDNYRVKSFISLPIRNINREKFAILNVDSDITNQFISSDYISKIMFPNLYPFILFLRLGISLFDRNSQINNSS